ncbi:MAG: ImmA/IrrE family metallo-endopeptidase [Gammaproteobacteria bacterium]|nr:ImmA/IrrE family metallo-endopeptidase [Gammaproteobacteria bacterium]
MAIAEWLGATVRYAPHKGELAGMLIRDDAERGIVIGVNSLHRPNRQRFTIAHECGHLLLHKGKRSFVDRSFRIDRRDEVSSQATDAEEIEANRFAAELLMPHQMIKEDLMARRPDIEDEDELRELADKYGVSLQAMMLRIRTVVENAWF